MSDFYRVLIGTTGLLKADYGFQEIAIEKAKVGKFFLKKDDAIVLDFPDLGRVWMEAHDLELIEQEEAILIQDEDKTELMPNSREPFQEFGQIDEKAVFRANFCHYAYTSQQFNSHLRLSRLWDELPLHQREALEGILRFVAEIANCYEGGSREWKEIANFANLMIED